MKFPALALVALLLSNATAHADATTTTPTTDYSGLLAERTIGPAPHSLARDQGSVGFCWAYSLSGLMEGEALKRGQRVTLSPEYLGLHHMATMLYQMLPIFAYIDGQSVLVQLVIDLALLPNISSEGSISFSEALADLNEIGMVPETFFHQKYPTGLDAQGNRVEIHPTVKERVQSFVTSKLLRADWVKYYQSAPDAFRKDFFDAMGVLPPKPTDTFVYQGTTYTPISFMREYLQFNPEDYQEVVVMQGQYQSIYDKLASMGVNFPGMRRPDVPQPVLGLNQSQALRIARAEILARIQVPVAFVVYNDQQTAQANGVFSPANCQGGCNQTVGGHAVLITGLKENSAGDNAIVIKNSWGNIGLDETGSTLHADNRGFFLITSAYLTQAENQAGMNGWSMLVQKRFLQH